MTSAPDNLFVVTGGPGAGKSTLLAALSESGCRTWPEAGRAIIQLAARVGAPEPPTDPLSYAAMMHVWDARSHAEASRQPGLHLFDRGIPDTIGYLELVGVTVPGYLAKSAAIHRYARTVLACPPWRAIYENDTERRQDWAEAVATFDAVTAAYRRLGYELVTVPTGTVEERARFVLSTIAP